MHPRDGVSMIDRRKNICYVIEVPYEVREKGSNFISYKRQKFLSLHGSQTKHFEEFRNKYFREVLKVSVNCIGEWDKDGSTMAYQRTISRKAWQDAKVRTSVMEGITEREKCR